MKTFLEPNPHVQPIDGAILGVGPIERPSNPLPRPPPSEPRRRYPSLSDDGQPWFPRFPWPRWRDTEADEALRGERSEPPFLSVRAIALLLFAALIAALAMAG